MKVIWKYVLGLTDRQSIDMPVYAKVLTAQLQHNEITLWVEVETPAHTAPRAFEIVGTGHQIQSLANEYIATVQRGEFVWHVFEVK